MAYILTLLMIVASSGLEYVRLSDQNRVIHFDEFSTTSNKELTVTGDDRFWNSRPFSVDYSVMSWVQIQEQPASEASLWRIYLDSTNRQTPALLLKPDGNFQGRVSTSANSNVQFEVPSDTTPLIWRHVTIIVCGTGSYAQIWVTLWNGSVACGTSESLTGTVITLDDSSIISIGASFSITTAKQQILDLRYYNGQWLTTTDIDTIVTNEASEWSSACSSGCWGPGNYSWNDFITLIDPLTSWVLNGTQNGYKSWGGDDGFLQARTYDSEDIALVGWFGEYSNSGTFPTYLRVNTEECECCSSPGCRVGALTRDPTDAYKYCHYNTSILGNDCVSVNFTGGAVSNWRFVIGSTCASGDTLYACYGNVTTYDGITWETVTNSNPFAKFVTDGTWSRISVGSPWLGQSDMEVKDARYYYSQCLDSTEMDNIKTNMMCIEYCQKCVTPNECETCVDGFILSGVFCVPCACPCLTCEESKDKCTSCYEGKFLLNDEWVDSCDGSGSWTDTVNRRCEECAACCVECTGPLNTDCKAGAGCGVDAETGDNCYAQPDSNKDPDDTDCQTSWPIYGYYANDDTHECLPCHKFCKRWGGPTKTDYCINCNSPYLRQPGENHCLEDYCPDGYWKNTDQAICEECDHSCATCFVDTNTGCDTCSEGYYLQILDAVTCTNAAKRCECLFDDWPEYNYYKDTTLNSCEPCHLNCIKCSGNTNDQCYECATDQIIQPDPHVCEPCHTYCTKCSGNTNDQCYECTTNYILQPHPHVTTCELGCPDASAENENAYYIDPVTSECALWNRYWAACFGPGVDECTACQENYFLQPSPNNTTCIFMSCPDGYYGNTTSRECEPCHASCKTCEGPTDNDWTSWFTNWYLQPDPNAGTCIEITCPTGYFQKDPEGIWEQWNPKCQDWETGDAIDDCTECPPGQYLKPSGVCGSDCGAGMEADATGSGCIPWGATCSVCQGTGNYQCDQCCEGDCADICPGSYYGQHYGTYNCYSCHWYCATCSKKADSAHCTAWATGYVWHATDANTCINPCPDGQYPVDAASTCGNWSTGWKTCTVSDWYECLDGYYMQPGSDEWDTTCPDGTYPLDCNKTCPACNSACETCTGPTNADCIECAVPYCRYDTNPEWSSCPSSFYCNFTSKMCDPCHPECVECYGPEEYHCELCPSPLYRLPDPHECGTPCPTEGIYVDESSRICKECHRYWANCTGRSQTACTEWNTGYFLLHGTTTCAEAWPIGQYKNGTECDLWDAACAKCLDGTKTNWSAWNAPYMLHETSCVIECEDGDYLAKTIQKCLPCHIFCTKCTDGTRDSCSGCKSCGPSECNPSYDAFLEGSTWTVLCVAGNYGEIATHTCEPCHETCLVCESQTMYDCTNCFEFSYLHGDGSCKCFPRFYPVYGPWNCLACHIHCYNCTGPLDNEWIDCSSDAEVATDGKCYCMDGYYDRYSRDPTKSVQCKSCHEACATWAQAGGDTCLSCGNNASLVLVNGGPGGECNCDDGYYDSDKKDPQICTLWDSSCLTCESGSHASCFDCSGANQSVPDPPGPCLWDDGYFDNENLAPAVDCDPWQPPCTFCTGLSDSDCLSCYDPNAFVAAPPGECACMTGYYDDNFGVSPIDCQPWYVDWEECAGPSDQECTSCVNAIAVVNVAPLAGKWECVYGDYDENNGVAPLAWKACHADCSKWGAGTYQDWTECSDVNSDLENPPVSAWVCNDYYFNLNVVPPNDCQPCHLKCKTCQNNGLGDWLTCDTNAFIRNGAPGRWECEDGFYDDNLGVGSLNCLPCHEFCLTWVGGDTERHCLSCVADHAYPDATPGVCTCEYYYFDANFGTGGLDCQPCHARCAVCFTTERDGCTEWRDPNAHVTSDGIGEWVCVDGFFETDNSTECLPCHAECATWMERESYHWLTCHGGNIEVQDPPASCVCTVGMYDSATKIGIIDWEDCDPEWLECDGPTNTECTQCILEKLLIDGVCTDEIRCPVGYYQIRNNWLHWSGNCLRCVNSKQNCLTCAGPKFVNPPDCRIKTCQLAQYVSQDDWVCYQWADGCLEWDNAETCKRWERSFYKSEDGICYCRDGFQSNGSECIEICGDGINLSNFDSECDDGNHLPYDGCTPTWLTMRRWQCKGRMPDVCTNEWNDYTPPEWVLSVKDDNDLILTFNEPVENVEYANLDVYIEDVDFTWDIKTLTSQEYKITLNFKESINKGTLVRVILSNNITDYVGHPARDPVQTGQLERDEIFYTANVDAMVTAIKWMVSFALFLTWCWGSLRNFWGIFNSISFMTLLPMINISPPDMLYEFSAGVSEFELPLIYELLFDEDYFTTQTPPTQGMIDFGYEHTVFLNNANDEILMWISVMLVYPIYWLLTYWKYKAVKQWAVEKADDYDYNFQHRTFIELYLETGIAAWLQVSNSNFENWPVGVSSVFGILFAGGMIIYPIWIYGMLVSWYDELKAGEMPMKFDHTHGSVYYEIDKGRDLNAYLYYFYFLIRRLVYAITLVFLYEYPRVQLGLTWAHSLIFLVWFVYTKPFESNFQNWLTIFTEQSTLLVMAEFTLLLWTEDVYEREAIAWYYIWTILAIIACETLAVTIFELFGDYDWPKIEWKCLKRKKSTKRRPKTRRDKLMPIHIRSEDDSGFSRGPGFEILPENPSMDSPDATLAPEYTTEKSDLPQERQRQSNVRLRSKFGTMDSISHDRTYDEIVPVRSRLENDIRVEDMDEDEQPDNDSNAPYLGIFGQFNSIRE